MTLAFGIRMALAAEGLDNAQIAQIETALPAMARLLAAYRGIEPTLEKAMPDIKTTVPVIEMLVKFIQQGETR